MRAWVLGPRSEAVTTAEGHRAEFAKIAKAAKTDAARKPEKLNRDALEQAQSRT